MIVAGALQRSGFATDGEGFVVTGGVALELRLSGIARATRDLDLTIPHAEDDPVVLLRRALVAPYQGFGFRIRGDARTLPNGASRVSLSLDYRGSPWGTIRFDLSNRPEPGVRVDLVEAIDLSPVGLVGPNQVPCITLPRHFAEKIHAVTRPGSDQWPNNRFRDLADILLMEGWIEDYDDAREACRQVFQERDTHPWPPEVTLLSEWQEPFREILVDLDLDIEDLHQAVIKPPTNRAYDRFVRPDLSHLRGSEGVNCDDVVLCSRWIG